MKINGGLKDLGSSQMRSERWRSSKQDHAYPLVNV